MSGLPSFCLISMKALSQEDFFSGEGKTIVMLETPSLKVNKVT